MADADILKRLRDLVLDESEPLPGLLRKCSVLGAVTGSDELREWANGELKGYATGVQLPPYRVIDAQLYTNRMGGYELLTHHQTSHLEIPKDLRRFVPEQVWLRQSVEELAALASSSRDLMTMTGPTFAIAANEWTKRLGEFQAITAIYFEVPTSAIAGIVDIVRTTLLEMVIDMTRDDPLEKLPSQAKVDSVVQVHIGSQVNVGGSNSGVIGQGDGSTQIQNHSAPSELAPVIAQLRASLADVSDPEQRGDVEQAIDDFEEAASAADPDPEKAKRRWGMLERITTALGVAAVTEAVKGGAPVVMEHLQLLM